MASNGTENRRSGMILDENFDIFDDQKEEDEAMSKEALQGIARFKITVGHYCRGETFQILKSLSFTVMTGCYFKPCIVNNRTSTSPVGVCTFCSRRLYRESILIYRECLAVIFWLGLNRRENNAMDF